MVDFGCLRIYQELAMWVGFKRVVLVGVLGLAMTAGNVAAVAQAGGGFTDDDGVEHSNGTTFCDRAPLEAARNILHELADRYVPKEITSAIIIWVSVWICRYRVHFHLPFFLFR